MRTLVSIAAALTVYMLVGPITAQVPRGGYGRTSTFVAQNILSEDMGRCALSHDRRHAVELAESKAGSSEEHRAIIEFMPALKKCLAGSQSATLDPSYLRGGVAEALLDANDEALLKRAARMTPVRPTRPGSTDRAEPNVALLSCAAAAQPADAASMLLSPAASPAEAAAFGKLAPALQACVPGQGEVRLAPARIRPAMAIALYRLQYVQ